MQIYGMTDVGQMREINQDRFCLNIAGEVGYAVVCDGMGGQSGGNIASEMTCSIIENRLKSEISQTQTNDLQRLLVSAVSEANIEVYRASNMQPGCKGMGTTAIAAIIKNNTAYIAHIGDSRAYLLDESGIHQITHDHSLVQELVDQGKISRDEAITHPNKNMITRAVGVNLQVDIDYLELMLNPNSKLLICTDGLTNMVSDDEIQTVLSQADEKTAAQLLISAANAAGGTDNITAVVIAVK